jgi:hypothetical protein
LQWLARTVAASAAIEVLQQGGVNPAPTKSKTVEDKNRQRQVVRGKSSKAKTDRDRLRLGFAEVRFAAGFDSGGERIALALGDIFAALDEFIGAFAEFAGFALRVVATFVGFLGEIVASFFARLWGEEDSD